VISVSSKRTVTALSTAAGSSASNVVDGNASTQWTSAAKGTQWITVDLDSLKSVSRILLSWGSTYASSFKVQTSADNASWSNALSTSTGTGAAVDLQGLNPSARYVRIYMTVTPGLNYSIKELTVFGA